MIPLISEADINDIVEEVDLLHLEGCHFFRVPIAESEDGRWLVNVDAGYRETYGASPCEGVRPIDFAMFGYEITVFDQVEGTMFQTMDPRQSRCGIPDEMRHLVIEVVQICYLNLIVICDPDYIYRFTWIGEPSENALKKHVRCTETLTQCGYDVLKDGTKKDGCKFWSLGRCDSDHSDLEQPELLEQLGAEP